MSRPAPAGPESAAKGRLLLPAFLLLSLWVCAMGVLAVRLLPPRVGAPYETDIFFHQFVLHEGRGALLTAALLVLAAALAFVVPERAAARAVACFAQRPWFVATVSFFVLAAGSLVVYQNHPLAMDEYMAVFQAQVFAEGEIYGHFPPELIPRLIPAFFLNKTFIAASLSTGKVISTYLPGFALLLTPFTLLGMPWALNPLLSAGTLVLIWRLARRFSDDPLAPGWAVLFTLASPVFTVHGISYYASSGYLFFNLLFMTLLLGRTLPRAFAAGVTGSLALTLSHPVAHALFAAPWLVRLLWKRRWKTLAALAAGYLPVALILGLGWLQVRSAIRGENAAAMAAEVTAKAAGPVAVGADSTPVLGEFEAFLGVLEVPGAERLAVRFLNGLELFFWALPGLPLLALAGFPALRRHPGLRLLTWSAAATLGFYFFVSFSQGHGWGYRYFHPAWAVLPLLAAAAMEPSPERPPRWRGFVGVLALLSLVAGTWLRFDQVHEFIRRHRAQVATAASVPQVRFVEIRSGYYTQDLIQNDPFLRGPEWTFISFGRDADAELVRRRFPGAELAVDLGYSTAWTVE